MAVQIGMVNSIATTCPIGIKVSASNLSATTYNNDMYTGKYDLGYSGNEAGGPAPYYELRQELYSPNSAPIGKIASSNWERYSNKKVDNLIHAYADKVDLLIGPYATANIVAAVGVAQRYGKIIWHHTAGVPGLLKYDLQFPTGGLPADPPDLAREEEPVCEALGLRGARLGRPTPPPEAQGVTA